MAAYYSTIPHHQYCSDYYSSFSTEFCSLFPSNMLNYNNNNYMAPLMNYYDIINSPVSVASFPQDQQFEVNSQMSSEIEMGFSNFEVFDYQQYYDQVFEPGDDDQECIINGLMVPKYWPAYNINNNTMAAENRTLQGNPVIKKVEEMEVKVGRYSAEEKKDRILRYLKKRNQRNFNKTIKYACRKTLADKRVRVRGRFAKNNEPCEEEIVMNTSPHTSYEQNNLFFQDSFQMKYDYDEDCWFQAAIANLMQLPYC